MKTFYVMNNYRFLYELEASVFVETKHANATLEQKEKLVKLLVEFEEFKYLNSEQELINK
jgi:hypothetical protein